MVCAATYTVCLYTPVFVCTEGVGVQYVLYVFVLIEFPNRGLNQLFPRMMEWSQSSQGQRDAFTWFTGSQLSSVIRNGVVPEWFHGIISRK